MKTILSLLLVALLVVSAFPFALADDVVAGVDVSVGVGDAASADASAEASVEKEDDARRDGSRRDFVDRIQERKHRFVERVQIAEKLRVDAEKYRGDVARIRADVRSCNDDMTEECQAARVAAQEHLLALADRVLSLLERLEARVEASNMDAELKAKMLADISAGKVEVQAAADAIVALGPDATRADYQEASAQIRAVWTKMSKGLHLGALNLYTHRYENVIAKAERADAKMDAMIDRATDADFDVAVLLEAQASFDTHIGEAKTALVNAQAAARSEDRERARVLLREAHDHLAQAHAALKEFMQAHRDLVRANAEVVVEAEAKASA